MGGNDIVIGGRFGDTINAGNGSNLVIGDSGRITAASAGTPQFSGVPMTFGLIETIEFGDGGSDDITAGADNDIVLGGHNDGTDGSTVEVIQRRCGQQHRAGRRRPDRLRCGQMDDASDIDLIENLSTTAAGGIDNITTLGGRDIVIGGRFGDTIDAGDGSNLVIGDSGRVTAANAGVPQFSGVPMTFGQIETIEYSDGGSDTVTTGAGEDIILGGAAGDDIRSARTTTSCMATTRW